MRNLQILMTIIYSTATLGYNVELKNGKAFITPDKVQSLKTRSSNEISLFCKNAKRYLNQFRGSMESNNCLDQEQNSRACHAIKRAFQRIASSPGALGTDLPTIIEFELTGDLISPMKESDKEEIALSLGLLKEQIVYPSNTKLSEISQLKFTLTPNHSIFSTFTTTLPQVPDVKENNLYFSNRLSACAYLQGDYSSSALVKLNFTSYDKTPQRVIHVVQKLSDDLREMLSKYPSLSSYMSTLHKKSLNLLYLSLDFIELEKKMAKSKALQTYKKVTGLAKMDQWWQLFFKVNEENGVISLKEITEDLIRKLYGEEKIDLDLETRVEIESEATNED